jgi:hypothetical protein
VPILLSLFVVPSPASPKYANTTTQVASVKFVWDPNQTLVRFEAGKLLFIGWVNQLNAPIYSELTASINGSGSSIMPLGLEGVVFAVLTSQQPDNFDDLMLATLAGPAILTIS